MTIQFNSAESAKNPHPNVICMHRASKAVAASCLAVWTVVYLRSGEETIKGIAFRAFSGFVSSMSLNAVNSHFCNTDEGEVGIIAFGHPIGYMITGLPLKHLGESFTNSSHLVLRTISSICGWGDSLIFVGTSTEMLSKIIHELGHAVIAKTLYPKCIPVISVSSIDKHSITVHEIKNLEPSFIGKKWGRKWNRFMITAAGPAFEFLGATITLQMSFSLPAGLIRKTAVVHSVNSFFLLFTYAKNALLSSARKEGDFYKLKQIGIHPSVAMISSVVTPLFIGYLNW